MRVDGETHWMLGLTGRIIRAACVFAVVCGVVSAIYLTDRRSGNLQTITWLPRWLHGIARWADYHGRFRNTPAYGMLSVPVLILFTTFKNRGRAVVALALFATVMEYTQLFIPTRFFDWYDIIESWLGILIVWVLVEFVYLLSRLAHNATQPRRTHESHSQGLSKPRLSIPGHANE